MYKCVYHTHNIIINMLYSYVRCYKVMRIVVAIITAMELIFIRR